MQKLYTLNFRKAFIAIVTILAATQLSKAQSVYLPNSYQLYQKFNADIYSVKNSTHTSLRPFLIDSTIIHTYDSVMNVGVKERKTWGGRKLFNEHLFDIKDKSYTFYADYLTDVQAGRDFSNSYTTNLNTRGFQLGGTVGDKFSFYSSGFENSAKFVSYYNDYVNTNGFVPGLAYARHYTGQAQNSQDWSYVTAILSYSPTKKINITLGQDKMFIGDGYRSVLLSDFAANMPLLRVTADLGPVRYMMAWAYLQDLIQVPRFDSFGSNPRKWALFHYIDWSINKRASLGFFNALITPEADASGNRNGFDANFVNPLFFSGSLGRGGDLKDNILLGFNAKYKILDKTALYGQIVFDKVKNNDQSISAGNTNGWQVGIRGADIFKVKRLNYLFEFNTVKPYTYSSDKYLSNYGFYGDPLAHPLGANFRELLGILNYSVGRFDFQGQVNYAKYGLDASRFVDNNGKVITKRFTPTSNVTGTVGQGVSTQLYYGEGTIAYILNPKYNLRFELGALYRQEKNDQKDSKNTLITLGLRSSFRNLYHDF